MSETERDWLEGNDARTQAEMERAIRDDDDLATRLADAEARADAAESKLAAVERLIAPMGEYRPYAVALDDGVHLAVLIDDIRTELNAPSHTPTRWDSA